MTTLFRALFFLFLISTTSISYGQDDNNDTDRNSPAAHAESSERLTTIMRRLFSVVHEERIEENLALTQADLSDLLEAVEELIFYSELMSAKVPESELEINDRVIFNAMASQLYDESLNIQQLTKNYNFDHTDTSKDNIFYDATERLNQTCAACHQLFRDK
ncbi:MAG: hypothetical protein DHS20C09_00290 [marine bacterium B5-7]|nr:MAG: hypothetical protein DHS20C09_00290 [marine bacterium B5-7]